MSSAKIEKAGMGRRVQLASFRESREVGQPDHLPAGAVEVDERPPASSPALVNLAAQHLDLRNGVLHDRSPIEA